MEVALQLQYTLTISYLTERRSMSADKMAAGHELWQFYAKCRSYFAARIYYSTSYFLHLKDPEVHVAYFVLDTG